MTTNLTQFQKDWRLNHSVWDKYIKRNKNQIVLKNEYLLITNDYGSDHYTHEILDRQSNRQVALINIKKTLYLSFCIISVENNQGNRVLL